MSDPRAFIRMALMKNEQQEKRRLERFDLNIPARIERLDTRPDGGEEAVFDLLTSDICSGGAYFYTPAPLSEGTRVRIDLVLPLDLLKRLKSDCHQAYIKLTGTVLRSESGGMAICFNPDYQILPHGKGPSQEH